MKQGREKIYLDICALGRPYDDQRYPRIEMETLAVLMISTMVKAGRYSLFYAPIHEFELSSLGIGFADSFHVANAEFIGASFITCDDVLIKKCSRYDIQIWFGTPIGFCKKDGLI
jgi:hypothetical protein